MPALNILTTNGCDHALAFPLLTGKQPWSAFIARYVMCGVVCVSSVWAYLTCFYTVVFLLNFVIIPYRFNLLSIYSCYCVRGTGVYAIQVHVY